MIGFRTPPFWYRDVRTSRASLLERALTPLSTLYAAAHTLHRKFAPAAQKIPVPVICIGNLTAGGTGKTPAALAILDIIRTHFPDKTPFFLTRGYGGTIRHPVLVDASVHSFQDVGDEALLLAAKAPTVKAIDRALGARLAMENGADIILMDDGLQNPSLHKDIKICVIDGEVGFGNEKIIPAGPLRTPLSHGLQNVDIILMMGGDTHALHFDQPVITGKTRISPMFVSQPRKAYIAFAGIGRPEKFFTTLRDMNLPIESEIIFADHHPYRSQEILSLKQKAHKTGAELITTEKDMVRIPAHLRDHITALPITAHLEDISPLVDMIKNAIE